MKISQLDTKKCIKSPDKTDWNKIISQSETETEQKSTSDPDSPVLENKKYYKPSDKS